MTQTRTIDALCNAYVDDFCALDPLTATSIGVAGHEHEMTDYSPAGFDARDALNRAVVAAVEAANNASSVGGLIPGTLFSLAVRVAPDEGSVSTTVGWMQQWSAFGQFAGPPIAAWAAARAGGWHVTWWVTGACALAGMAIAATMGRVLSTQHAAPHS